MDEDLELTVDGTVYHSLDALPAELREKLAPHIEKARAAAAAAGGKGAKIRIKLTHKTSSLKLGGSLPLGGGSGAGGMGAGGASGGPGAGGPVLDEASRGGGRAWLFWALLLIALLVAVQRLRGH